VTCDPQREFIFGRYYADIDSKILGEPSGTGTSADFCRKQGINARDWIGSLYVRLSTHEYEHLSNTNSLAPVLALHKDDMLWCLNSHVNLVREAGSPVDVTFGPDLHGGAYEGRDALSDLIDQAANKLLVVLSIGVMHESHARVLPNGPRISCGDFAACAQSYVP